MGSRRTRCRVISTGNILPVLQEGELGLTVHHSDGIRVHAFLRSNGILRQNGSAFHISLRLCPL